MVVIGSGCPISLGMRQQQLHHVAPEPVFAQQRRSSSARTVRREVRHAEVEAFEEVIQRRLTERHRQSEHGREHVAILILSKRAQQAQQFDGLR